MRLLTSLRGPLLDQRVVRNGEEELLQVVARQHLTQVHHKVRRIKVLRNTTVVLGIICVDAGDRTLVEDAAGLHEDHHVKECKHFRRRLVDGAEDGAVLGSNILQQVNQIGGRMRVQPSRGLVQK